eukprot:TRINITY_DN1096_c0_g1_i2.p1 TRINITY_DN1096_c0_g1~~TRINITY_DN1096_c0_g1_i2.p1  ORF type:complete len:1056 (+),score=152.01 TRINITY_DN1096_c0_g1_i2:251-3418(+)
MSQQPGFNMPGVPRPGFPGQQGGQVGQGMGYPGQQGGQGLPGARPGQQGMPPGMIGPPGSQPPGIAARPPSIIPRPGMPPSQSIPQQPINPPHPASQPPTQPMIPPNIMGGGIKPPTMLPQQPRPGMSVPRPVIPPQQPQQPPLPMQPGPTNPTPTPNMASGFKPIPGPVPSPGAGPGVPQPPFIPGKMVGPPGVPNSAPAFPGQAGPQVTHTPPFIPPGVQQNAFQPGTAAPPSGTAPIRAPPQFAKNPAAPQFVGYQGQPGTQYVGSQPIGSPTSAAVEQLLSSVEQLSLGPATPGGDGMVHLESLPRPTADKALAARAPPHEPMKGSCNPSFMRMTVGCIPQSQAVRARWQLPLGILVQPLAECGVKVPVINPGMAGIMRCRRCRTYINPFVQWSDGGKRWKCNVCTMLNEVPHDYFCSLDEYGIRRDVNDRPELSLGSVEYIAPEEYMVRAPMPPSYFFLIDVSVTAVQTGVIKAICEGIKESLNSLPGGDRTRVGFMTYDRSLHFYNLRSSSSSPQMMVIGEIDEPFVPVPDDLLVELADNRDAVETLLTQLPSSFPPTSAPVDSALGPALQAALMVISGIGGKLVVFQSGIPSLGAGKINNRENVKLYGSDREHVLRNPEDAFFKNIASECNRAQITVDFFSFCPQYVDLASLSAIPKYTCGSLHYIPGFNPQQSTRLITEIKKLLGKDTAWEAVMRIRSSRGLSITNFLGHFFVRSSDLLALPTADSDKTFAASIKHEESVLADQLAYIQCALLYTASCGERRIRVHTLAVPVVTDLNEMYRLVDGGATAAMMAKLGVEKSYSSKLEECRQAVLQKVMLGFKEFRIMHAQHFRAPNQLAFPPNLKYLPAWTLGATKCAALRAHGRDSIPDERVAVGFEIMQASVDQVLTITYPSVYRVDNLTGNWGRQNMQQTNGTLKNVELPPTHPASYQVLDPAGAYLMDNGRVFVLWIGRAANTKIYEQLFNVSAPSDAGQLNVEPARSSELSQRLNNVLNSLRDQRSGQQQCFVVIQGSPVEAHILPLFIEDRGVGSESLLDYLQNVQRSAMKM